MGADPVTNSRSLFREVVTIAPDPKALGNRVSEEYVAAVRMLVSSMSVCTSWFSSPFSNLQYATTFADDAAVHVHVVPSPSHPDMQFDPAVRIPTLISFLEPARCPFSRKITPVKFAWTPLFLFSLGE
jgi:hypothetical protein